MGSSLVSSLSICRRLEQNFRSPTTFTLLIEGTHRPPPVGFCYSVYQVPAFCTIALSLLSLCMLASSARAQLPDPPVEPAQSEVLDARAAFVRGTEFAQQERFEDARREFMHSYALSGSPVALFNLASTLRSLGHHHDAAEALVRLLANPHLDAQIRRRAEPMYALEVQRVGRLRLHDAPGGATLRLDGGVPRALHGPLETIVVRPGTHSLRADLAEHHAWTWSGGVGAGEALDLVVELTREAPEPAEDDPVAAIAVVASLVAVAIGAIVTYAVLDAEAQLVPRTGVVIELP